MELDYKLISNVELDGLDQNDYPDFVDAYINSADYNGEPMTEEQLNAKGIQFKTGQFPMRALGRSRASMDLDGFVKILADKKTDEILGVHIIGARAADLIAEAVTAMEFRASAEDVSRMSHSHPTYSEAIKEAALAATENRALHM